MMTFGKTWKVSTAAVLLLASVATSAQSFVPGGGVSGFGIGGRGMTIMKGTVLCAGCTLDEVRKAQSDTSHLYQLTHKQGHVVMRVNSVNGSGMWDAPWPPRFSVRAKGSVFAQLTAEANLMKEMEITGILSNTRTLDIFTVTISG